MGFAKIPFVPPFAVTNPTNGQTFVYDAASGTWKNGAGGGGNPFDQSLNKADTVQFAGIGIGQAPVAGKILAPSALVIGVGDGSTPPTAIIDFSAASLFLYAADPTGPTQAGLTIDPVNQAIYPQGNNLLDLGLPAFNSIFRTGYFGTSVDAPLFTVGGVPGITTTITAAALATQNITVIGGIITDFS